MTTIRPLREGDLDAADRVFRLAFGTFLGLRAPLAFAGDADYVRQRWRYDPTAAFAAEIDGELVGSNFATSWGSVGFFGPLSVRPDRWDAGVGRALMAPIVDCFARWRTRHAGLFTFAQSAKHVGLYQHFGFWPRHLTAIMGRPVATVASPVQTWSGLPASAQASCLAECRALGDAIFPGLDLGREIRHVAACGIGDTVLVRSGTRLIGMAVCHTGAGSEAGSGACFVKFGAVAPGANAAAGFERLLAAVDTFAAARGLGLVQAGVNTARTGAYRALLAGGFRTQIQGVSMTRDDDVTYDRPDVFVLDDWR